MDISSIKRRSVAVTPAQLVTVTARDPDAPGGDLPVMVAAARPEADLCAWVSAERATIEQYLLRQGAVLFRGFAVGSATDIEALMTAIGCSPLPYRERSSPRRRVLRDVYTSTEYPASERIFFHNENSYQRSWPMKLCFMCVTPAATGGATPLSSNRVVASRISEDTWDRFARNGVLYVRNYSDRLGLGWRDAFQATSEEDVEAYCAEHGLECEWLSGDRLRTRYRTAAVAPHPRTGEALWFNHATFFHVTTLPDAVRTKLLQDLATEDLPHNTYYGDGTPIDDGALAELRAAYEAGAWRTPWQRGDVLLIDNMLVAHGRDPFTGDRSVLVAMAESHTRD